MKTYDYKWIDFLSGNNTIKVTNKNEFSKFKDFLNYLGLTDILNGINTFSDFQNLARINNTNENMFLFEYVNHKGLTWNDDIKKSTEWYGKEPINVSELEITKPKMKLYDLLKIKDCIDTYDTKYDTVVTMVLVKDKDIEDNYDKFCNYLQHEVEVTDAKEDICDWTGFVKKNMEALKKFTKEYWVCTYENNEDEFIYQWINELHAYSAGYTSENVYKAFLDTITTHKQLIEQTERDIDICE